MDDIFHPDFTTDPYWWEAAAPTTEGSQPPPEETDVAIVGSGYTGLTAAIELADRGHRVTVLEARDFGYGASTRNGGHASSGFNLGKASSSAKPSPLVKHLGLEHYNRLLGESVDSLLELEAVIEREAIDCDYQRSGRFAVAYTPTHFKQLVNKMTALDPDGSGGYRLVPRERQRDEIGSDFYHGGIVVERSGRLHPALYHRGLLHACQRRGVSLSARTPVTAIAADGTGFRVRTPTAELRANEVLLATNAYSQEPSPWLRRRVIPLASCMIATEELDPEVIRRLNPNRRTINDTKRILSYFRISPDGKRLLYGGRESFFTTDPRQSGRLLYARMTSVYPQLAGVRITHSWSGLVAMSFDHLPHMGTHDGIHYCAGCNGSGVAMMSYLGRRVGRKIAGDSTPSAYDGLPFPTRPTYTGTPWFLPAVGGYYRAMDRLDRWRT